MRLDPKHIERMRAILRDEPRYAPDAYVFVQAAVTYAQERQDRRRRLENPHIRGPELLDAIRELALREFGPLALSVLRAWGVESSVDFGHIVFTLVRHRLLGASDDDSLEDFRDAFDLAQALTEPFLPGPGPARKPPVLT